MLGTQQGEMLKSLAMQSNIIVEIGTFYGLGSTQCLAAGLVRGGQIFYTIDPHEPYHNEARKHIHDGRVVFLTLRAEDVGAFENDFILFDGDDESTDVQFDKWIGKCSRFVALDDTMVRKNRRQRRYFLDRPEEWTVLADVPKERNGWMIVQRKT